MNAIDKWKYNEQFSIFLFKSLTNFYNGHWSI